LRFDTVLKDLFDQPPLVLLSKLLGRPVEVVERLSAEVTAVQRPDLVLRLAEGRILHVELQAQPDDEFAHRMLHYRVLIRRKYSETPLQLALWVGKGRARLTPSVEEEDLTYRFRMVDEREVDAEDLLASESIHEAILGLLGRLRNPRLAIHRILRRMAMLPPDQRKVAVGKLMVLSELRGLEDEVKESSDAMPIVVDMSNSIWVKEAYAKGLDAGLQKGIQKGIQKGVHKGVQKGLQQVQSAANELLLLLLKERFGPVPRSAATKIKHADIKTIKLWTSRAKKARTLEQVLE